MLGFLRVIYAEERLNTFGNILAGENNIFVVFMRAIYVMRLNY